MPLSFNEGETKELNFALTSLAVYTCPYCGETFATQAELDEHIAEFHPPLMEFTARTETYAYAEALSAPYYLSIDKPVGTANGDILFCKISSIFIIPDSVPDGWTLLGSMLDYGDKHFLYYKIAYNEPAFWTWGFSGSNRVRMVCSCYYGDFDPTNPIDVVSNTAYRVGDNIVRAASMNVTARHSPLLFWATIQGNALRTFIKPSVPTNDWIEDDDAGDMDSRWWTEICSMIWAGFGNTGNIDATCSYFATIKHAFAVALNPR